MWCYFECLLEASRRSATFGYGRPNYCVNDNVNNSAVAPAPETLVKRRNQEGQPNLLDRS